MRPFSSLISLKDAIKLVLENASPITESEEVPIESALGRVVAKDVQARVDVPPFPRSAMDGYAVKAEDTYGAGHLGPKTLRVIGSVRAGEQPSCSVGPGEAVEIATGAVLPSGADAVVVVEKTELEGDKVRIFDPVYPQENVSPKGSDIAKGTTILHQGDLLHYGKIGTLAALGMTVADVRRKPRVMIVPTGNEVCDLGRKLSPSQVYDVNSYTLATLATENGCAVVRHPVVEDTFEAIDKTLEAAKGSECVIFSGGSSVGERDVLIDVLKEKGEILFHGVQIKPGKPTLLAKIDNQLVFGLPGYPAACLMVGHVILAPALRKMASLPARRTVKSVHKLSRRVVSTLGRHQFLTVKVEDDLAVPVFKESGAITSLADAEGYIQIPPNVDFLEKGQQVEVTFF